MWEIIILGEILTIEDYQGRIDRYRGIRSWSDNNSTVIIW